MDAFQPTPTPVAREDTPNLSVLEETTGSQLPPFNHLGANSSCQPEKEIWSSFWSNKTKQKQFHKACDVMKKVQHSVSKIWFLTQCLSLCVAPRTCDTIKPRFFSNDCDQREWIKLSEQTTKSIVTLAKNEEKVRLVILREQLCVSEIALHHESSEDPTMQGLISDALARRGKSFLKQANNTHKQRLCNLLNNKGFNVPDYLNKSSVSSINISNLSTTSSRKFTKKSKRQKENKKKRQTPVQLVTNYTNTPLTPDQEHVLNLGLNFCPTRKSVNRTDVEVSCSKYGRGLRWTEFHWSKRKAEGDETDSGGEETLVRESIFKDPTIKTNLPRNHLCPPKLLQHIHSVHDAVVGSELNEHHPNLEPKHWVAIKELKNKARNREIVVKATDKTGGVSIIDCDKYVNTMETKLTETFCDTDGELKPKYVPSDEDALKASLDLVKSLVTEGCQLGYISESDAKIMVPAELRPGRLYGLVKDHKPADPVTGIPPLREVVSGSGSVTEYISSFVDHHLKPEVKKLPSFIEDTPDFLREVERRNSLGNLPPHAIPVSMDVVALYPNVPWKEGLEAMELAGERREDKSVPTQFLARLMLIVLATNIFEFDGKLYLQKYGTAIGTRAAPTFANLFMGWWENLLQEGWSGIKLEFFKRFIDDLFFIWLGTREELQLFIDFANSIFPTIKVTAEYNYDTRSVNYLDMKVWIDQDGYIRTDLYRKENKKITYLLPTSAHPSHISGNIPYSLAYRLLRLCWSEELLQERLAELLEDLMERGYRRRSVLDTFDKLKSITREQALKKVSREKTQGGRNRFVVR